MGSPESPYASSNEDGPRRSLGSGSPSPDETDKQTFIRFLVSNMAAGCIIGKGGSTITEFQSQSGARIQLSRNHEFFPGTSDRIILVSGVFNDVIKAMELIVDKLQTEGEDSHDSDGKLKLRLIVANNCCGAIIGKGGSTIKSFIEESNAGIKISPQDNGFTGLHDRLVTLTGNFDELLQAIFFILSKLSEDSYYSQSVATPYNYAGVNYTGVHAVPVGYVIPSVPLNAMGYVPNGMGAKYPSNKTSRAPARRTSNGGSDSQSNSKMISVADEHVGAVLGKGGRSIMEISQTSGARIKISDRGDFISGTSDRKVTLTGSWDSIGLAETMILNKVSSVSER